jgi:hypothetical protein
MLNLCSFKLAAASYSIRPASQLPFPCCSQAINLNPLPQVDAAAWYRFLHQTASELAAVPAAELALQLFLTCAHSASGGQGR